MDRENRKGCRYVLEPDSELAEDIIKLLANPTPHKQMDWRRSWRLHTVYQVQNARFRQSFCDKRREMTRRLAREPSESFAFGVTEWEYEASDICDRGDFSRQHLGLPLGNVDKGVNLCLYPAVLLQWAEEKGLRQPCLVIYKILKGRRKVVPARISADDPFLEPSNDFDQYTSRGMPEPSETSSRQLSKSQIFLFEFDEKMPSKHPRHCLPYATMSLTLRESNTCRASAAETLPCPRTTAVLTREKVMTKETDGQTLSAVLQKKTKTRDAPTSLALSQTQRTPNPKTIPCSRTTTELTRDAVFGKETDEKLWSLSHKSASSPKRKRKREVNVKLCSPTESSSTAPKLGHSTRGKASSLTDGSSRSKSLKRIKLPLGDSIAETCDEHQDSGVTVPIEKSHSVSGKLHEIPTDDQSSNIPLDDPKLNELMKETDQRREKLRVLHMKRMNSVHLRSSANCADHPPTKTASSGTRHGDKGALGETNQKKRTEVSCTRLKSRYHCSSKDGDSSLDVACSFSPPIPGSLSTNCNAYKNSVTLKDSASPDKNSEPKFAEEQDNTDAGETSSSDSCQSESPPEMLYQAKNEEREREVPCQMPMAGNISQGPRFPFSDTTCIQQSGVNLLASGIQNLGSLEDILGGVEVESHTCEEVVTNLEQTIRQEAIHEKKQFLLTVLQGFQQMCNSMHNHTSTLPMNESGDTLMVQDKLHETEINGSPSIAELPNRRDLNDGTQEGSFPSEGSSEKGFHTGVQRETPNERHFLEQPQLTGKQLHEVRVLPKTQPELCFHGHPLITKQKPRKILMENTPGQNTPVDPRPARSAMFGRRCEQDIKIISWSPGCEGYTCKTRNGPEVQNNSRCHHLEDPRLLKRKSSITDGPSPLSPNSVANGHQALSPISLPEVIAMSTGYSTQLIDTANSFTPRPLDTANITCLDPAAFPPESQGTFAQHISCPQNLVSPNGESLRQSWSNNASIKAKQLLMRSISIQNSSTQTSNSKASMGTMMLGECTSGSSNGELSPFSFSFEANKGGIPCQKLLPLERGSANRDISPVRDINHRGNHQGKSPHRDISPHRERPPRRDSLPHRGRSSHLGKSSHRDRLLHPDRSPHRDISRHRDESRRENTSHRDGSPHRGRSHRGRSHRSRSHRNTCR